MRHTYGSASLLPQESFRILNNWPYLEDVLGSLSGAAKKRKTRGPPQGEVVSVSLADTSSLSCVLAFQPLLYNLVVGLSVTALIKGSVSDVFDNTDSFWKHSGAEQ